MKKTSTLAAALCGAALLLPSVCMAAEDITVDEAHFPDANFRTYISEKIDTNADGVLSADEVGAATYVDVSEKGIASLAGIEYLSNAQTLLCWGNKLTDLDVSKNEALTQLTCSENQLTQLDLTHNTNLAYLYCYTNKLTSLDLSKNTKLSTVYCNDNQLTALDLSQNNSVRTLICGNNQIKELNVSNLTRLWQFDCGGNQLTELDVSNNKWMETLRCWGNQLTSLDVSQNTSLYYLEAFNNKFTTLDVSAATNLHYVWCYGCELTQLTTGDNSSLAGIYCHNNQLTQLDLSGNSSLVTLYCSSNQLVALDLSQNTKLETLDCQDNEAKFADKIVGGKSYVPVSSLEARGFDVNRVDQSLLVYANGVECVCLGECPSADTELSLSYKYDTGNSNVGNPTFTISRIVGGETDGVNALTGNAEPAAQGFYTTGGVKTSGLKKGLNIVRFADGSCKKVMVK